MESDSKNLPPQSQDFNQNGEQNGDHNADQSVDQTGNHNRQRNEDQTGHQNKHRKDHHDGEIDLSLKDIHMTDQGKDQNDKDESSLGDTHDEDKSESETETNDIPLSDTHNSDQSESENEGKQLSLGANVIINMHYIPGKGNGSPPGVLFASHTHPDGDDEGKPRYKDGVTQLLNNDEVVCAVGTKDRFRVFHVVTTAKNKGAKVEHGPGGVYKFNADWKLDVVASQATYMPSAFVKDNGISSFFPYLAPYLPYMGHTTNPLVLGGLPQLYVIVSTKSGSCQAAAFYHQILRPFLLKGHDVEREHKCIMTTSSSTIRTFARDTLYRYAKNGKPQTVILISGDGGVVDIINGLWSYPQKTKSYCSPNIGIIPMGTGNALATSMGLSRDKTIGLRRFCRGVPQPLPTFTVRFSPGSKVLGNEGSPTTDFPAIINDCGIIHGAVVCSWALHASVVADSDTAEYRKHGNERFTMAAQELLRPTDGSPMHVYKGHLSYISVDRDGTPHQIISNAFPDLHSYVLVTLVSHLEPGFNVSPASRPLDGRLRLLRVAAPISGDALEAVMIRAFTDGSHVDDPVVEYKDVSWCRIEIDESEREDKGRRICVDGTIVIVPPGGWIEVKIDWVMDSRLNIVA